MPRTNTEPEQMRWTRFRPDDPLCVPLIMAFGTMIDKQFNGSFDEYTLNREKIGKKPYRKKDGSFYGVKEFTEKNGQREYFVRLPYPYLEDLSKWEAYQILKPQKVSALPF